MLTWIDPFGLLECRPTMTNDPAVVPSGSPRMRANEASGDLGGLSDL
jgi:hypothetical protein